MLRGSLFCSMLPKQDHHLAKTGVKSSICQSALNSSCGLDGTLTLLRGVCGCVELSGQWLTMVSRGVKQHKIRFANQKITTIILKKI